MKYVQELQATANSEHGEVQLQSLGQKFLFELIALGVRVLRFVVSGFAVLGRIHIFAASQHESFKIPQSRALGCACRYRFNAGRR